MTSANLQYALAGGAVGFASNYTLGSNRPTQQKHTQTHTHTYAHTHTAHAQPLIKSPADIPRHD